MSDAIASTPVPETPKKSKSFFWIIVVVLVFFSIDHYTLHTFSGGSDNSKDTTSIISTPKVESPAVADSVKKDTTKKK